MCSIESLFEGSARGRGSQAFEARGEATRLSNYCLRSARQRPSVRRVGIPTTSMRTEAGQMPGTTKGTRGTRSSSDVPETGATVPDLPDGPPDQAGLPPRQQRVL